MSTSMLWGSLEEITIPSREMMHSSSMSSSFAISFMWSIGMKWAVPTCLTAVLAIWLSIVSIAPASVLWRSRTEKSSCDWVFSHACREVMLHVTASMAA